MVDHRGLPLAITLSPGQASDKAAVAGLLAAHPAPGDVVADRGYDARTILDLIAAHGGRGHIPTQRDRKVQRSVDPAIYRTLLFSNDRCSSTGSSAVSATPSPSCRW